MLIISDNRFYLIMKNVFVIEKKIKLVKLSKDVIY